MVIRCFEIGVHINVEQETKKDKDKQRKLASEALCELYDKDHMSELQIENRR